MKPCKAGCLLVCGCEPDRSGPSALISGPQQFPKLFREHILHQNWLPLPLSVYDPCTLPELLKYDVPVILFRLLPCSP